MGFFTRAICWLGVINGTIMASGSGLNAIRGSSHHATEPSLEALVQEMKGSIDQQLQHMLMMASSALETSTVSQHQFHETLRVELPALEGRLNASISQVLTAVQTQASKIDTLRMTMCEMQIRLPSAVHSAVDAALRGNGAPTSLAPPTAFITSSSLLDGRGLPPAPASQPRAFPLTGLDVRPPAQHVAEVQQPRSVLQPAALQQVATAQQTSLQRVIKAQQAPAVKHAMAAQHTMAAQQVAEQTIHSDKLSAAQAARRSAERKAAEAVSRGAAGVDNGAVVKADIEAARAHMAEARLAEEVAKRQVADKAVRHQQVAEETVRLEAQAMDSAVRAEVEASRRLAESVARAKAEEEGRRETQAMEGAARADKMALKAPQGAAAHQAAAQQAAASAQRVREEEVLAAAIGEEARKLVSAAKLGNLGSHVHELPSSTEPLVVAEKVDRQRAIEEELDRRVQATLAQTPALRASHQPPLYATALAQKPAATQHARAASVPTSTADVAIGGSKTPSATPTSTVATGTASEDEAVNAFFDRRKHAS